MFTWIVSHYFSLHPMLIFTLAGVRLRHFACHLPDSGATAGRTSAT